MTEERPEWRTPTVVSLCKAMRAEKSYEGLPILADALEESGYSVQSMLNVIRNGKGMDHINAQRFLCEILGGEFAEAVAILDEYAKELKPYFRDYDGETDDQSAKSAYRSLIEDLEQNKISGYGADVYSERDIDDLVRLRQAAEIVLGKQLDFEDFTFRCSC